MNIGWSSAVYGVADGRVVGQLILQIHDGLGAPDEEDGVSVVQAPHLVRREQFFATMSSDEFKKGRRYQRNSSSIVSAFLCNMYSI